MSFIRALDCSLCAQQKAPTAGKMSQLVIAESGKLSGKRALFNELIHSCRTSSSPLNRHHHHHRNRLHTFSVASRKALIMNFIHPSTISSSCVVVTPSRLIFNGSTFIFTLSSSSIMCSWLKALNSVGRLNAHIAWSMVLLSVERGARKRRDVNYFIISSCAK